ncbi:MAG: 1-acyl-sn-glycerol-3-phosphate acyltransferase [Oscillospiraceae bacterium]|jgi:1-acyl-sn-glycerol-3-phosphate acyltransferase|nr:1-acyl-sn-glycerol-3-phosphate acyltransferase [Oscillospiraceae bacterium]
MGIEPKNDQYLNPPPLRRLFDTVFYHFVVMVLRIILFFLFGLRVRGRENLKNLTGGFISISNHVHHLDCGMVSAQMRRRRMVFASVPQNLKDRGIGFFTRHLGCFPVPKTPKEFTVFENRVKALLERGWAVHFFPEGHLEPYCKELRPFTRGAFVYACRFNVPVVPMTVTYRAKVFWKRKPPMTLTILPPVFPEENTRAETVRMLERCRGLMDPDGTKSVMLTLL